MNNESQKVLSKEESYKLLQELIAKGCLKTVELKKNGVRHCTLIECWEQLAYEKYQYRLYREGLKPAVLIKRAYDKLSKDIEDRNKRLSRC